MTAPAVPVADRHPASSGAASQRKVEQIHALTGVRAVAALWVVLFHIRGNIASEFPWLDRIIGPVLAHGELGVDLFFALSGYVLALNYGQRMGLGFDKASTLRFWWARLARIWPAYAFTLAFAATWHGLLLARNIADPVAVRDYSVSSFLRQLFLVVQWTEPDFERLTWNGAAWSVSAEAFAYLLFPLIILLVFRLNSALSTRALIAWAGLSLLPVVFLSYVLGLYSPWMWVLRILCSFIAGALIFYVTERIRRSGRNREVASYLVLAATTVVIICCYVFTGDQLSRLSALIVLPLVIIVGALGLADKHAAKLLGTKFFVVGGMASYSIYLVHMPIIEIIWFLQGRYPAILGSGSPGAKIVFASIPILVAVLGYLLWRYLEEPARRKMRVMSTQNLPERAVDDPSIK